MADPVDFEALELTLRAMDGAVASGTADPRALRATAEALVASGRGVLAVDESNGTASKRLEANGMDATAETRLAYRRMLVGAPGLEDYVAGIILYDETVRQTTAAGEPIPAHLAARGILPGAKVDTGTIPLAGHPDEEVTKGLDGLRDRLADYRRHGIAFAKWRAVIRIGDGLPSTACLDANAAAMARYAATCQEAALDVTTDVLRATMAALAGQAVSLEALVLKTNMVVPGLASSERPTDGEIAEATLAALTRAVPPAVAGVAFLSGGQDADDATRRLDTINRTAVRAPWPLTFSYARALQQPALVAWCANPDDVSGAQALLVQRARCNAAAAMGSYEQDMERTAA